MGIKDVTTRRYNLCQVTGFNIQGTIKFLYSHFLLTCMASLDVWNY